MQRLDSALFSGHHAARKRRCAVAGLFAGGLDRPTVRAFTVRYSSGGVRTRAAVGRSHRSDGRKTGEMTCLPVGHGTAHLLVADSCSSTGFAFRCVNVKRRSAATMNNSLRMYRRRVIMFKTFVRFRSKEDNGNDVVEFWRADERWRADDKRSARINDMQTITDRNA